MLRLDRRLGDREAAPVQHGEEIAGHELHRFLGIAALGHAVEERRRLLLQDQHARVVGREAVFLDEARLTDVRQLGQGRLDAVDERLRHHQRQQVGIGEVAIVVRVFLGAQRPRLALGRLELARLLHDPAAAFDHLDLATCFELDGLLHEADRVHVLDLAARAQFSARLAHRDVDVATHGAFVHVAVAGAEIAHDRAQLGQVRRRLVGGTHVGLADDFHERHSGAIEVDIGLAGMLVVQALAGVLLQMQTLDTHRAYPAVRHIDLDHALAHDRVLELRDLIALRLVGIEVVLAVEHRAQVDLGVEAKTGAHRLLHAALVDHGQHAGHAGVDQRHLGVGIGAERRRRAGEELGFGDDLGMDFESEHDLPVAGFAFDE